MEVKIQIPDNCELIKDGNTYVVRQKMQEPPRSWEEFCERYPVKKGEAVIDMNGNIHSVDIDLAGREHRNWDISKEEAEAFLALMQLRQLRKAWVGDWETHIDESYSVIFPFKGSLKTAINTYTGRTLSFPTKEMAENFLNCFIDLCEIAKPLL